MQSNEEHSDIDQSRSSKRQRPVELRSIDGSSSDWQLGPSKIQRRCPVKAHAEAVCVVPVGRKRNAVNAATDASGSNATQPSSSSSSGGLQLDDGIQRCTHKPETETREGEEVTSPARVRLDDGVAGAQMRRTDRGDQGDVVGSRGWLPGVDTNGWCGKNLALHPQANVLIANAHINLQRIPAQLLSQLVQYCQPVGSIQYTSRADQALSGLVKVPARTINYHVATLKKSRYALLADAITESRMTTAVFVGEASKDCARESSIILRWLNAVPGAAG
jgi:hypothetical protein